MFGFNTFFQFFHPFFTTWNHNYFLYLRCFVVVSFVLLGVPDHGAVPNHGPVQGAVCTKLVMVLYHTCDTWCFWTKSWCWTSSICGTSLWITSLSLRPSKNQKNLSKHIPKNLEKPSKTKEHLKDLFPGSLGQDMSLARVAENSKGDRRCLDEICAKWNAYMCL